VGGSRQGLTTAGSTKMALEEQARDAICYQWASRALTAGRAWLQDAELPAIVRQTVDGLLTVLDVIKGRVTFGSEPRPTWRLRFAF